MDCDRVFYVLTSRPFPSGAPEDSLIESHLVDCDSCRQIADALRPCEGGEPEPLPPSERRGLPRYVPQMSPVTSLPSATKARLRSGAQRPGALSNATPRHHGSAARLPLDRFQHPQQLAAFSLVPPRERNRLAEAASLVGIALLVAFGGWGLGLLAM